MTYEYLRQDPAAQKPSHPLPPIETVDPSEPNAATFQPSIETFDPDKPPEKVFPALNRTTLSHVAFWLIKLLADGLLLAPVTLIAPDPEITPEKTFVTPAEN